MKKVLLALALFLGLANSLFAISINDIDLGTHPRPYITQIDIRDSSEFLTKLNVVTYKDWNSGYPRSAIKYSGTIDSWLYTTDYQTFYPYYPEFDSYLDATDLKTTFIYVYFPSGVLNSNSLQRDQDNYIIDVPGSGYPMYIGNSTWIFRDMNSSGINHYETVKEIIPDEGGVVYLYNNVSFDRTGH